MVVFLSRFVGHTQAHPWNPELTQNPPLTNGFGWVGSKIPVSDLYTQKMGQQFPNVCPVSQLLVGITMLQLLLQEQICIMWSYHLAMKEEEDKVKLKGSMTK